MIQIHKSFIIFALGFVLCGYYMNIIAIFTLIVVHEMGHYLSAKIFGFNVRNIIIYPFGGLTKFDDLINKKIEAELLVAISGIIFQTLFYFIIYYLNYKCIIRDYTFFIFRRYHRQMFIFNLLPIYPLDGFKIFNLFLSKFIYYNLSNYLSCCVSVFCLLVILFSNMMVYNYSYFMVIAILIMYCYKYIKKIKYIYNRFLLERCIYDIRYKRSAIINNKNKMFKNKLHIFNVNGKYVLEKKYLNNYFLK